MNLSSGEQKNWKFELKQSDVRICLYGNGINDQMKFKLNKRKFWRSKPTSSRKPRRIRER